MPRPRNDNTKKSGRAGLARVPCPRECRDSRTGEWAKSRVLESEGDATFVRRWRVCAACGVMFETRETRAA